MNYKITKNIIQVILSILIILGIVFSYIFKTSYLAVQISILDAFILQISLIAIVITALKILVIYKYESNKILSILFAIIDLILISYIILINNQLIWPYFIISVYLINLNYLYGRRFGYISLPFIVLIMYYDILLSDIIVEQNRLFELSIILILQITICFIASLIGHLNKNHVETINNQNSTIESNISLYNKLSNDLEELKQFNEDLEIANKRLELTNQKLNKSAAEYYTLQQISQAIATIVDIEELLKFINDVIIGVMGVNYSSIILFDKDSKKLSVKVTSIISENALDNLNNNINCDSLKAVIQTGKPLFYNKIEEGCSFTKGRDVKSLLCVPLFRKKENFGIILVEQDREDAFTPEHLKFLISISNQISIALENVSLYVKMQRMATIDALTNIYNRLYFNERISKEMVNADQEHYPISVCIFDIDNFKKFNDTYGHLFGDLVLKTIAKISKDYMRENDVVARFGGEEFVIIMSNTTVDQAYQIIEELRKKIADYRVKDGSISASITASFGISCYPEHGSNESEILRNADEALYQAKKGGKNRTVIFESKR